MQVLLIIPMQRLASNPSWLPALRTVFAGHKRGWNRNPPIARERFGPWCSEYEEPKGVSVPFTFAKFSAMGIFETPVILFIVGVAAGRFFAEHRSRRIYISSVCSCFGCLSPFHLCFPISSPPCFLDSPVVFTHPLV